MMKPYEGKSPGIKSMLNNLTGKKSPGVCKGFGCDSTKTKSEDFKDKISRDEYRISGLCQECQNKIWG